MIVYTDGQQNERLRPPERRNLTFVLLGERVALFIRSMILRLSDRLIQNMRRIFWSGQDGTGLTLRPEKPLLLCAVSA